MRNGKSPERSDFAAVKLALTICRGEHRSPVEGTSPQLQHGLATEKNLPTAPVWERRNFCFTEMGVPIFLAH